jgi:hypothetical protein
MNELRKIRAQIGALNAGIVPFGSWGEEGVPHHDFTRILDRMDPEEARKHRRKFRKMWRKIAKESEASTKRIGRRASKDMGLHKVTPTRQEKNTRKFLVAHELMKEESACGAKFYTMGV